MQIKKLSFVALASIVCLFARPQDRIDRASLNLKGKVKSVTTITYDADEKFGDVVKGKKRQGETTEFNSNGNETSYVLEDFEKPDNNSSRATKYNDNNLPVEIKEIVGGISGITKNKYNGNLIESVDVTELNGDLVVRVKNTYRDGLLAQEDIYGNDGKLTGKAVYTYNSKKQLAKKEYFKGGNLSSVNTYVYDSKGNTIETSTTNYNSSDKSPEVSRYAFNQKNQKIEYSTSYIGLDKKELYEYNLQGDLVKMVRTNGTTEVSVYTYDSNNNWITCTLTHPMGNGLSYHKVFERQIKYY